MSLLRRECALLLAASRDGRGSPLPAAPLQYADYAVWESQLESRSSAIDWWAEALAGAPQRIDLPSDRPRPATPTFRGSLASMPFPAELVAGCRATRSRAPRPPPSPSISRPSRRSCIAGRANTIWWSAPRSRDGPGSRPRTSSGSSSTRCRCGCARTQLSRSRSSWTRSAKSSPRRWTIRRCRWRRSSAVWRHSAGSRTRRYSRSCSPSAAPGRRSARARSPTPRRPSST